MAELDRFAESLLDFSPDCTAAVYSSASALDINIASNSLGPENAHPCTTPLQPTPVQPLDFPQLPPRPSLAFSFPALQSRAGPNTSHQPGGGTPMVPSHAQIRSALEASLMRQSSRYRFPPEEPQASTGPCANLDQQHSTVQFALSHRPTSPVPGANAAQHNSRITAAAAMEAAPEAGLASDTAFTAHSAEPSFLSLQSEGSLAIESELLPKPLHEVREEEAQELLPPFLDPASPVNPATKRQRVTAEHVPPATLQPGSSMDIVSILHLMGSAVGMLPSGLICSPASSHGCMNSLMNHVTKALNPKGSKLRQSCASTAVTVSMLPSLFYSLGSLWTLSAVANCQLHDGATGPVW